MFLHKIGGLAMIIKGFIKYFSIQLKKYYFFIDKLLRKCYNIMSGFNNHTENL